MIGHLNYYFSKYLEYIYILKKYKILKIFKKKKKNIYIYIYIYIELR